MYMYGYLHWVSHILIYRARNAGTHDRCTWFSKYRQFLLIRLDQFLQIALDASVHVRRKRSNLIYCHPVLVSHHTPPSTECRTVRSKSVIWHYAVSLKFGCNEDNSQYYNVHKKWLDVGHTCLIIGLTTWQTEKLANFLSTCLRSWKKMSQYVIFTGLW